MTDELRAAAEADGALIFYENGEVAVDQRYRQGFEACASQGLSADEHLSVAMAVRKERARSAKLIERLRRMARWQTDHELRHLAQQAIAEYEAARD